jgi:uncharacterized membrane protein YdjX (TVP38/TMEM64 family)
MTGIRARLAVMYRSRLFKFVMVALAFLVLTLAWYLTPLSDYARPDVVRAAFARFAESGWAPLVVPLVFVGGGLIAFPLTIMIVATAAAFGPWLGTLYSVGGALLSALSTYAIGALLGREALRDWLGPRLDRVRERIRRQGVIAVMAIRLVPVAPFTVVNVAMGASEIRLLDYLAGTLLGLAPGLIVMAALGHRVMSILSDPSVEEVAILAALVVIWITVSFGVQFLVARLPAATGQGGGR